MANLVKNLSFLFISLSFIACSEESEFLVPGVEESSAITTTSLKLIVKDLVGNPVPDVTVEITVYGTDGLMALNVTGKTDASGEFIYHLDSTAPWRHIWVSTQDERFPGVAKLELTGNSITHTWVAMTTGKGRNHDTFIFYNSVTTLSKYKA